MTDIANTNLIEFVAPEYDYRLTNQQLIVGAMVPAKEKLKMFSDKQFEECVKEWAYGYLSHEYNKVYRCGGAGDMGRDVIGYVNYGVDKSELVWDNYQCKHYKSALNPSNIWVEIGKLCYYTYINKFTIPRKYFFVCPNGVSISLHDLLNDKDEFKKQFIKEWDNSCKKKITSTKEITLDEELLAHINQIDFRIFNYLDPDELISQHRQTPYYAYRFGGGLHKPRPKSLTPPTDLQNNELVYTKKLFEAYGDSLKTNVLSEEDLEHYKNQSRHFQRQRVHFYQAESLMRFERDTIPPNVNAFEELKDELYYGIVDTLENDYEDGFQRVKAVTDKSRILSLTNNNPLSPVLTKNDQHGMCHHLVNDNKIDWVNLDE
ncbi:hypothetical protein RKD56_004224 [Priestia megaterium]